ncbi:MAG: nifR3 family TIM-barrel protein, partial [Planctomycetota bacterium]
MEAQHDPRSGAQTRFATEHNLEVPVAAPGEFTALELGGLRIWPPIVLAPMAGVTSYPYRSLCREYGAGLFVSEMITARGYLNDHPLTQLLASGHPDEEPRSVQIYGSDPMDVGEMVKRLVAEGVHHIDLNLGCPVRKVTRHGGGSAIPAKPRLMARLLRAAVASAGEVPVTVKVRKGLDADLSTFQSSGRVAQEEGAAAICLHARTAADLYSGTADWPAIGELVNACNIPVLGNGDIWEAWDALRMMRETGCAAVVVGRGCLGRPWLFRELADVFEGREPQAPPNLGEVAKIAIDHARRVVEFFGENIGMRQMRKWAAWYTKGFANTAAVRSTLATVNSLEDFASVLGSLDSNEPFPLKALTVNRAKRGGTQKVSLPEGYLDDLEDDTPPKSPHSPEELVAWERA